VTTKPIMRKVARRKSGYRQKREPLTLEIRVIDRAIPRLTACSPRLWIQVNGKVRAAPTSESQARVDEAPVGAPRIAPIGRRVWSASVPKRDPPRIIPPPAQARRCATEARDPRGAAFWPGIQPQVLARGVAGRPRIRVGDVSPVQVSDQNGRSARTAAEQRVTTDRRPGPR